MTETLADAYPKEQARVRALLAEYHALGPSGVFGAVMIECVLARADRAAISGDAVEMLRSFKEMQECQ